jgi:hypothetical protein
MPGTQPPSDIDPPSVNHHEFMCDSIAEMAYVMTCAFSILTQLCANEPDTARHIRWHNEHGTPFTLPMILRTVRRDLEWMEQFFARGEKK